MRSGRFPFFAPLVFLISAVTLFHPEGQAAPQQPNSPPAVTPAAIYQDVTGLVARASSEAGRVLQGFFSSGPVVVEPFVFVTSFSRHPDTALSLIWASQLAAAVPNSVPSWTTPSPLSGTSSEKGRLQTLGGSLQEVDGFLRIHIIAQNARQERQSQVINIEMSEPLYRSLHSTIITP